MIYESYNSMFFRLVFLFDLYLLRTEFTFIKAIELLLLQICLTLVYLLFISIFIYSFDHSGCIF